MQHTLRPLLGAAALVFAAHASAQITFYEGEGFRGRAFATDKQVWNFERDGFNDRASSSSSTPLCNRRSPTSDSCGTA